MFHICTYNILHQIIFYIFIIKTSDNCEYLYDGINRVKDNNDNITVTVTNKCTKNHNLNNQSKIVAY